MNIYANGEQYQSLERTWHRRPELLTDLALTAEQESMLEKIKQNTTDRES